MMIKDTGKNDLYRHFEKSFCDLMLRLSQNYLLENGKHLKDTDANFKDNGFTHIPGKAVKYFW